MSIRRNTLRLASSLPKGSPERKTLLRMAMEFPTEEALKEYLQEHPNANPRNHRVVEEDRKVKKHEVPDMSTSEGRKQAQQIANQTLGHIDKAVNGSWGKKLKNAITAVEYGSDFQRSMGLLGSMAGSLALAGGVIALGPVGVAGAVVTTLVCGAAVLNVGLYGTPAVEGAKAVGGAVSNELIKRTTERTYGEYEKSVPEGFKPYSKEEYADYLEKVKAAAYTEAIRKLPGGGHIREEDINWPPPGWPEKGKKKGALQRKAAEKPEPLSQEDIKKFIPKADGHMMRAIESAVGKDGEIDMRALLEGVSKEYPDMKSTLDKVLKHFPKKGKEAHFSRENSLMIRLASSLPKGSPERKALLKVLVGLVG